MHRLSVLTFSLLSGLFATFAHAGAPAPCVIATLSASRNILVLSDFTTKKEGSEEKVKTSTFRILRRHDEINAGNRLDGPDAYWTGSLPLWSVTFTTPDFVGCPYTLVTDDGEYLIFIRNWIARTALSIYRRRDYPGQPIGGPGPDYGGVLIRDIPLRDLGSRTYAQHRLRNYDRPYTQVVCRRNVRIFRESNPDPQNEMESNSSDRPRNREDHEALGMADLL